MSITITLDENIIEVNPVKYSITAQPVVRNVVQALPAGLKSNDGNYFNTANLFSELNNQTKKTQARQNLELQFIDCGEFN
jgi:hypothetical protein